MRSKVLLVMALGIALAVAACGGGGGGGGGGSSTPDGGECTQPGINSDTFTIGGDTSTDGTTATTGGRCTPDVKATLRTPGDYGNELHIELRNYNADASVVTQGWEITVVSQAAIIDAPVNTNPGASQAKLQYYLNDFQDSCNAVGGSVTVDAYTASAGSVVTGTFTDVGSDAWAIGDGSPTCPPAAQSGSFSATIEAD